jgi:hypothetical protein
MSPPLIICDVFQEVFWANRVLDPQYAARFPGASTWAVLGKLATQRGWQIMTADVFLRERPAASRTVLISEMITPYTRTLIERGAVAAIVTTVESPNIAWRFYHNLRRHTQPYSHAILFRGVRSGVYTGSRFQPLYWANARRQAIDSPPWDQRRHLVMVSSNKQRFDVAPQGSLIPLRRLLKRAYWSYLQFSDPLYRFPDLYRVRQEAIRHFAGVSGFHLYGTGWQERNGLSRDMWQIVQRLNPVPVDDKLRTVAEFKFALCLENCAFPGYVTEKIFDCFFAGSIPIYSGAPDISDFVPPEAFIDMRQFQNFAELGRFLCDLPRAEAQRYLQAAGDFMTSPAFDKFTADSAANEMMRIVEQEMSH